MAHVQRMYMSIQRIYMYIQRMYMVYPVVSTGFRGQHREADAGLRDIPWPSYARDDEDEGSPCPEDGDFFYARPEF